MTLRYIRSRHQASIHPGVARSLPAADQSVDSSTVADSDSERSHDPEMDKRDPFSFKLDKRTAQIGMMFDAAGLFVLSLGVPSPVLIFVCFVVSPLAGVAPSINSLALHLNTSKRETGRMLGAMSTVGTLGHTILGPLLFGNVFALTVGYYAPTFFAVSGLISIIGQFWLARTKDSITRDIETDQGRRE